MKAQNTLKHDANIHIMGIGGFGMNPIARVMHQSGYAVSGCDMQDSALLPALREMGIAVHIGHDPAHLDDYTPDALVISSAIPESNPEIQSALEKGIPVYKRADILCALMRDRTGIAIAGTHGKTTTTAMTAYALSACGLDPSFIVGGVVRDLQTNAKAGQGDAFVIEADEYDRMYLGLCPTIAVITTVEMDHPDMFGSLDEVKTLFAEFVDIMPEDGLLILGYDDANALALADRFAGKTITYGITGGDWQAVDIATSGGKTRFTVQHKGKQVAIASLTIPGDHNVQNALAALVIAEQMGADIQQAADALGDFVGAGRRFEVKGEAQGVTVIDDYAHHPTAIATTLKATCDRFPGQQIWAVWQPHTFSRTKTLLDEFAGSFGDADHVIITDIYRSRDKEDFGITPQTIIDLMHHPDARHTGTNDAIVDELAGTLTPGSVVIVMSAGDATHICDDLLDRLKSK